MYKIKLTPYRPELGEIFYRQTHNHQLMSADGRYRFYIDEPIDKPDFWVVNGKGVRQPESCMVAPQNTIMLATEPKSVLVYPQKYLRQFGLVCTCQENTNHPNVLYGPAILPWFVGYTEDAEGHCHFTQDYDSLKSCGMPEKTKLISVITSNKAFTQGHLDRIRFVKKLKEHYGDRIDIFGRGFHSFDDKWDVLAPYKYHIAIENSSQRYYWTEKLSDCYLCGTYPIYCGCTNLEDYFSKDMFTPIDIQHFDRALETIDKVIADNTFEHKEQALIQAKNLVLDKYNLFEYIARLCDNLNPDAPKEEVTIQPCRSADDWHNLFNYTISRNYYKIKQKLTGLKL